MSQQQSKLTIFCEMCNKPIDSNICPVHGIDFVTIKKIFLDGSIPANPRTTQKRRPSTRFSEPQVMPDPPETGLVPLKPAKPVDDAQLPAVPGDPRIEADVDYDPIPEPQPVLPRPKLTGGQEADASDHGIPSFQRTRNNYRQQTQTVDSEREEFVFEEEVEEEIEDYYEPHMAPQKAASRSGTARGWIIASVAVITGYSNSRCAVVTSSRSRSAPTR